MLVELNGKKVLFDAFISPNPLAEHIDISGIEADYMILSHGHADHVADAVTLAKQTRAQVLCIPEVAAWLSGQGVENVVDFNMGGTVQTGFGSVRMVTAHHSGGLPDGSYGGSPAGFVVSSEKTFYYAGDTALTLDMKLIPDWYKLDFAILPIGGHYTMDVDDAIRAADFVQTNDIIGMHYDTFPVIKIDHAEAVEKFASKGKKLTLLEVGESLNK